MSNPTYSIPSYGQMAADPVRMDAYEASLRAVCRPGCRVLDLGAGSGIMSLLACRFGAERVYAVEPSDVIALARALAEENGVADRITFLQQSSTAVTLPEPVDVIVADVRGVLPLTGTSLATMMDARRFLAPGGVLIPARDQVRGALVAAERARGEMVEPWQRRPRGFAATAAEQLVVNTPRRVELAADALLTAPADLFTLDYRTIVARNVEGRARVPVMRAGTAHGVALWFDATLVDGIGFSNEPGRSTLVYGQYFLPLAHEMALAGGDEVTLGLKAHQVHDEYIWSWDVTLADARGTVKAHTSQSTFDSMPLSLERFTHTGRDARPRLNRQGEIDRFALDRLDGRTSLGEIADALVQQFPDRFAGAARALSHVVALADGRTSD